MKAKFISALIITLFLIPNVSAQDLLPHDNGIDVYHSAPRYRDSESHPLRIVGYALHPVGWVLRETIFRPWSAFAGSDEMTKSVFGFREPFGYRRTECFRGGDKVPDCWTLAPYSKIGGSAGALVDGDDLSGVEGAVASEDVPSGERQVYFPDVNFDFDKASLTELGKGRVRQISQLLASVPSLNIVVEGHTDYIGSDQYNEKLGIQRAEAVRKELVGLGIDPARLSSVSRGETRPIFAEEEDWARAVNRRVQFSVRGEGDVVEAVEVAAPTESAAAPVAAEPAAEIPQAAVEKPAQVEQVAVVEEVSPEPSFQPEEVAAEGNDMVDAFDADAQG